MVKYYFGIKRKWILALSFAIPMFLCCLLSTSIVTATEDEATVTTAEELIEAFADRSIQKVNVGADISIPDGSALAINGTLKEIHGGGHSVTASRIPEIAASEYTEFSDITFSPEMMLTLNQGGKLDHVLGNARIYSKSLTQIDGCELSYAWISSGSNSYIKNTTVSGETKISDSSDCLIEECELTAEDGYGLSLVYHGDGEEICEVRGSTIKGTTALHTFIYGHKAVITDSVLEGTERGVYCEGTMGSDVIELIDTTVKSGSSFGIENKGGQINVPSESTLTLDTNNNIGILIRNGGWLNISEGGNIEHADNNYTVFKEASSNLDDAANILKEAKTTGGYSLYLLSGKDESSIVKSEATVTTAEELIEAFADRSIQKVNVGADISIPDGSALAINGTLKEIHGGGHSVTASRIPEIAASEYTEFSDITFSPEMMLTLNQGGKLDHVLGNARIYSKSLTQIDGCELSYAWISSGSNSYIKNTTVSGETKISDSSDCLIEECELTAEDGYGLSLVYHGDGEEICEVRGSTIKGTTALHTFIYGHKAVITDSVLEGTERGVYCEGTMGSDVIELIDTTVKSGSSFGIENEGGQINVPSESTLTLDTNNNIGILIRNGGWLNISEGGNIEHADNNYTVFKEASSNLDDAANILKEAKTTGGYSLYLLSGKDESSIVKSEATVTTAEELIEAFADRSIQKVNVGADISIPDGSALAINGTLKEIHGGGHSVTASRIPEIAVSEYTEFSDITFSPEMMLNLNQGGKLDHVLGNARIYSKSLTQIDGCELSYAWISSGSNSYIKNTTVSGETKISDSSDCLIEECELTAEDGYGLSLVYHGDGEEICEVRGSTIKGTTALHTFIYGHKAVITDSVLEGTERGVYCEGTMGSDVIELIDTTVKSGSSFGIENEGGQINVPSESTLTLDTNNNIGINAISNGSVLFNSGCTLIWSESNYLVLKDSSSNVNYSDYLITDFPIANTTQTGYCFTNDLQFSFTWADDYSNAWIVLKHKHNDSIQRTVDTVVSNEILREPTCTESGVTKYTATYNNFSDYKSKDTPANGHSFVDEFTVDREPSCTAEGSRSRHCANCDEVTDITAIPMVDHTYGKWTITKEATCTAVGSREKTCTGCGDKVVEVIQATGHDWANPTYVWESDNSEVTATRVCNHNNSHKETETVAATSEVMQTPTCTETGEQIFTSAAFENEAFEVQAKKVDIPMIEHPWDDGSITKDPTCSSQGEMTYHCTKCDATKTDPIQIDPDAHQWDDGVRTEAGCEKEGSILYTCELCDVTKNVAIDPTGHKPGEAVHEKTIDATCTTNGSYEEVVYCTACEAELSREAKTVTATGHTLNHAGANAVTCTADGNSEYWYCTKCEKYFADEKGDEVIGEGSWIIHSPGHQWDDGQITKEATCTVNGTRTFTCGVCKETQDEVIKAPGHQWNSTYTVDKKATYAAAGSKSIHCAVCNVNKEGSAVAIPKLKVKPTTLSKLTPAKKAITVKWKKGSSITGYQIQYALNSKFTSGKKTVTITKSGTVSKKITKLKAKKKYYVRVRTYKTVSGKKYYSTWSKYKYAKTK